MLKGFDDVVLPKKPAGPAILALVLAIAGCATAHAQTDETKQLTSAEREAVVEYLQSPACFIGGPYNDHASAEIIVTVDGNSIVRGYQVLEENQRKIAPGGQIGPYAMSIILKIDACPYLPLPHDGRVRKYTLRFSQ